MRIPSPPSPLRSLRGFTLIELMVGVTLALVVALAAGAIYLTNQKAWKQGETKLRLQEHTSFCAEAIARDIRASRWVDYDGSTLTCYDHQGAAIRTYARNGGTMEILQDGASLSDFDCTELLFAFNGDSSAVNVSVELEDAFENRVRVAHTTYRRNWNHLEP